MNQTELKQFIEGYQKFELNNAGQIGVFYEYFGLSKPKEPSIKRLFPSNHDTHKPFVKAAQPAVSRARIHHYDKVFIEDALIDTLLEAIQKEHGDEIVTNRNKLIITDAYGNVMDIYKKVLINSNQVYIYEIIKEDPGFEYLFAYLYDYRVGHRSVGLIIERNTRLASLDIIRIEWTLTREKTDKKTEIANFQKQLIAKSFIEASESRHDALVGGPIDSSDPKIQKEVAKRLLPELKDMVYDMLYGTEEDETNKKLKVEEEEEEREEGGICIIT